MAITKRNNIWWIDISHKGKRIRQSTGTEIKNKAQQLHDKLKFDLWNNIALNALPQKYWVDAVLRWLEESAHKRTLEDDKIHLRWADPYLRGLLITEINQDHIETIAKARESMNVSPATVNRMLEIIRAILRKAQKEWGWLLSVPPIRMRKIDNKRIRWLTRQETKRLLEELPLHLKDMAHFTLCTGLRESNVTQLKWQDVDLNRRHTLVHPEESKTKKAIPVPLNSQAVEILNQQKGKHPIFVFTYNGNPVTRCNNHAWRKALKRAGIKDFRWHDLRHTWASWHVQSGTSLHELQQLGGWSNYETVLRYAHLSGKHLQAAAERIM
ncbi:TPA: tyrosine-type recombinase/integrase [Legionella pneumophila]|uniref:tyrosine-type recombinase/integrase n=1 Tax=Legionella pneumophila TaxID=446 RepID=UPI0005CB5D6F|nr:site-specific integrase [Legionella pneumophila]HCC3243520.1 site-specific integrase [Legionella pneumophila subsp. pneumophila]MCZ4683375.1 site-specific integrase [Legionella pneumophila]HDV5790008.1 site-specific integrase [Legionella pneumophila]HDV5798991.1 site-specific integrase [Legionella pneumophila]HDV5948556.1 site-specific integrase [Legionella pneumophila]